jgi:hypothetical protein
VIISAPAVITQPAHIPMLLGAAEVIAAVALATEIRPVCMPPVLRKKSRRDRIEPVLVMETAENGLCHDSMSVRQSVVNRPRDGQP